MKEFILFMYDDATNRSDADNGDRWATYLSDLRATGRFDGGSSIGAGVHARRGEADRPSSAAPSGFIRVRAEGLDAARAFLVGNPVYEAGGTVEIRELPQGE